MNITMILTDAGRAALLDKQSQGADVNITHLVLGDGTAALDATATALTNELERKAIHTWNDANPNQLEMEAVFDVDPATDYFASEAGVIGDGILFAVWTASNPPTDVLVYRMAGVSYRMRYLLGIDSLPSQNITVQIQPLDAAMQAIVDDHVADIDPHRIRDIIYGNKALQALDITDQAIARTKGFLLLDGTTIDLTTNYTQTQKNKLHDYVIGDYADIQTAYTQDTSITVIDATEYFGRVTDRNLGSLEEDAIRNITGIIGQYGVKVNTGHPPTGPFSTLSHSLSWIGGSGTGHHGIDFDASRVVPTAAENRPKNLAIAKRWGIYIGE